MLFALKEKSFFSGNNKHKRRVVLVEVQEHGSTFFWSFICSLGWISSWQFCLSWWMLLWLWLGLLWTVVLALLEPQDDLGQDDGFPRFRPCPLEEFGLLLPWAVCHLLPVLPVFLLFSAWLSSEIWSALQTVWLSHPGWSPRSICPWLDHLEIVQSLLLLQCCQSVRPSPLC